MKGWLALLIGLIVAVSGIALLVWLLWRLWIGEEEVAPAAIEIEVPPIEPPVEPAGEVAEAPAAPEEPEAEEVAEPTAGEAPDLEVKGIPEPVAIEAPEPEVEADDLTAIEGIGPKISTVLREGGILTFAQLADTDPDSIRAILEAADPRLARLANPSTWPEQAALAAEDKWQALTELQGTLKGGRKA
jgi:predicted flap endonuclease-1-like 5' DNA nuclease